MRMLEAIHSVMVLEEALQPFSLPRRGTPGVSSDRLHIGGMHRGLSPEQVLGLTSPSEASELVLGDMPSRMFKEAMSHLASLEMPELSSIRILGGGRLLDEDQIAGILENPSIKGIQSLEVRNHSSMTDKMMRRVRRRFRGSLKSMVLINTGVTKRGISAAFKGQKWTKLEALRLHQGGMVDDDVVATLSGAEFPVLEVVDLGNCSIGLDGARMLGSIPSLKRVVVRRVVGQRSQEGRVKAESHLRHLGLLRVDYRP
jgi:hypothetical protein